MRHPGPGRDTAPSPAPGKCRGGSEAQSLSLVGREGWTNAALWLRLWQSSCAWPHSSPGLLLLSRNQPKRLQREGGTV